MNANLLDKRRAERQSHNDRQPPANGGDAAKAEFHSAPDLDVGAPTDPQLPVLSGRVLVALGVLVGAPFALIVASGGLASPGPKTSVLGVSITLFDVLATSCTVLVLVAGSIVLAALGGRATSAARRLGANGIGGLRVHYLFRMLTRHLAPAGTAAAIVAQHTGSASTGIIVLGGMIAASSLLSRKRYPLHVTSIARVTFDLCMPAVGVGLAWAIAALNHQAVAAIDYVPALLAAWVVTFAGGFLEQQLDQARPIRIVVVGVRALGEALTRELRNADLDGFEIVGVVCEDAPGGQGPPRADSPESLPVLGYASDLREIVQRHAVDLVVVAPHGPRLRVFEQMADACLDLPVRMVEAAAFYEDLHGRVPIGAINDAWFQHMMHPEFRPSSDFSKRLLDICVGLVVLIITAPLLVTLALAVRLSDGGPAFYRQRRVGARGRDFNVIKLRSMGVDAEAGGAAWSTKDDPRVTRLGAFMRKTHLDELPQVFNVLKGDMSLVGPRPERPEFVDDLERRVPYYRRRHLVKPGVTGWAQVHCGYAGSDAGTTYKLCHDLYYVKRRSLLFDVLIIFETLRTLVADSQYEQFTFSEAFILGEDAIRREAEQRGRAAVLGDTAHLAEATPDAA